jgi:cellulose synthase/poly-beta-1,6-N-acetylglucosamine synthase-like glycosyltransferase
MQIPEIVGQIIFYAFCATIAVQVFYYLYFFARLAWYKQPVKSQSQEYPLSVIVCARDEAQNLATNLPGVLVQDYKTTHEVIVVNDNSFDDSRYLLEEFQKSFKNLTPVELTQEAKLIAGKKFPLSIGIKTAKYEIVLLTDADCVPASEFWMQKMQEAYIGDKEIVLGYGAYHKKPGLLNKIIRFETFHTALQYLSYALAGMPYMGVGRNLSYRKELFFKNKGFSSINQIPGGDDDLFINMVGTKKNTAIVIDKDAHTLSEPKKTWSGWWHQKMRHFSTARYYKSKNKFALGLYSLTQFWVYPLGIAAALLLHFPLLAIPTWSLVLAVFGVRFILQAIVYRKTMYKLNEGDLWGWFWLFDIWMFIYYIVFFPAIFKKPRNNWS